MSTNNPALQAMPQRSWIQVGLSPMRARTDIRLAEEVWDLDVIGIRSDGNQFAITITLVPSQIESIPKRGDVAVGFHHNLMIAFARLESYRNCSCYAQLNLVCKQHQEAKVEKVN